MLKFAKLSTVLCCVALTAAACSTSAREEAMAEAASVSFTSPADGDTVSSPFQVTMAAENFTIEPSGEVVDGAGHFHILVNEDCLEQGMVIPTDETHLHYGAGQLEVEVELEPGEYTLCLQVGDGVHTATDLTDIVNITVE